VTASAPITAGHRRAAWGLGLIAMACYGTLYGLLPPIEGDSFDYASIGRNIIEHGEPLATHLRFPGWPEQALPAPGGRRAALMAWIMAPLYALFGASALVVALPFLFSILLLPRLILLALGPVTGPIPALMSAVAFLLHPRLMHHYAFDPNVEPTVICLILASFWAFRDRRAVTAGVLVGIAALVKVTAVILGPIYLALLWRHDRVRLRERATWLGAAAALLVFSPMVGYLLYLRATHGFFGDVGMIDYLSPEVVEAHYGHWFTVRTQAPPLPVNDMSDWFAIASIAIERFLGGVEYTFGTQAGVPEALGLGQLLCLPLGWRVMTRDEDRTFIGLWAGAICLIALLAVIPSTDARHIALVMPFTSAVAFAGLWHHFGATSGRRLAVTLIALQALPSASLMTLVLSRELPTGQARYAEIQRISDLVPEGKTLITVPFTSMSFFTGRMTVPMPIGPVTDVLELARQRDAGAIVIQRVQPGPCLPATPLLPPDVGGDHFCVYPLEGPPESIAAKLPADFAAFAPLDRQLAEYPRPGPFRSTAVLTLLATPWWLGGPLLALLTGSVLWIARRQRSHLAWSGLGALSLVSALSALAVILI
jgi:4-amino-4-deoxy-L-arabinose transferase-like glycosyltransferase